MGSWLSCFFLSLIPSFHAYWWSTGLTSQCSRCWGYKTGKGLACSAQRKRSIFGSQRDKLRGLYYKLRREVDVHHCGPSGIHFLFPLVIYSTFYFNVHPSPMQPLDFPAFPAAQAGLDRVKPVSMFHPPGPCDWLMVGHQTQSGSPGPEGLLMGLWEDVF